MITLEHFDEVDMRVGTITAVSLNKRARKPAYKITVDLGDFGTKNSSAQLTNYEPEELVGKQVVCVCNFEPMRIGDVKSEVRLLGSDTDEGCILLTSLTPVKNGSKILNRPGLATGSFFRIPDKCKTGSENRSSLTLFFIHILH